MKAVYQNNFIITILLLLPLILNACSSAIPEAIKNSPETELKIQQVQKKPEQFISQPVRWGGIIVDTQNHQLTSQLTIVALPLGKNGKPVMGDASPGRFIASSDEFLDPAIYTKDRQITVTGTISGSETRKVGDFHYLYVIVTMNQHYLWPAEIEDRVTHDPFDHWWYDPWYPWHHPYYGPYRRF